MSEVRATCSFDSLEIKIHWHIASYIPALVSRLEVCRRLSGGIVVKCNY